MIFFLAIDFIELLSPVPLHGLALFVMAGHSRSKNGFLKNGYAPAIPLRQALSP
jgi:hypothetical protein